MKHIVAVGASCSHGRAVNPSMSNKYDTIDDQPKPGAGEKMGMKRCERYWEPEKAARMQEMVKSLCGMCVCEAGLQCPMFSYKKEPLRPLVQSGECEVRTLSA